MDPEAMQCLMNFSWPGNVRQLENEVERIFVLSDKREVVTKSMLSMEVREGTLSTCDIAVQGNMKKAVETLEKKMIYDGLRKHNWNKSKLAKELGISRASLIMKAQKFGLEREGYTA